MTLGATNFSWDRDVSITLQRLLSELPPCSANTYRHHPRLLYRLFPNVRWSRRSVDLWAVGGRGSPLEVPTGVLAVNFLLGLSEPPLPRHIIWRHALWTSWGGWSEWRKDDHSGDLRHLHVTFWPT